MHRPDYTSRTEPGSCVLAHGTPTLMMSFNGYGHRESRQEADRIKKCPKRGHDGRGAGDRCPIEFGTQFPGYHTLAISGPAMLQLPKRHGRRRGLQPLASGDVLQQQCLKGRLRPDRVKSVPSYQSICTCCSVGSIVASVGVQKDRLPHICSVTIPPPTKLADGRLYDRQRIAASAPANVQMKRETGFLREEPDERRVPGFAVTFAAHEYPAALRTMAMDPRHQPIRGTAPKNPPRYFR